MMSADWSAHLECCLCNRNVCDDFTEVECCGAVVHLQCKSDCEKFLFKCPICLSTVGHVKEVYIEWCMGELALRRQLLFSYIYEAYVLPKHQNSIIKFEKLEYNLLVIHINNLI